jgi:RNA polymerase sigma factor (sigma-70 family)
MSPDANVVHIVDDDQSFRRSTARLLRLAGYEVTEHGSADDFLSHLPDGAAASCILLDLRMPGVSGLTLQERLAELGFSFPIIFLTGHGDIPTTVRAIKAGAEDLLTKPVSEERLLQSVEKALAVEQERRSQGSRLEALHALARRLTPREREVFERVVQGRLNKQIAFELGTSVRTIKAHRQRVMEKLQVQSVVQLVSFARDIGLPSAQGLDDTER